MITAYTTLISDSTFATWQKTHPQFYLVHAFLMKDAHVSPDWHFGFYSKETDSLVTFIVNNTSVTQQQNPELLKLPGEKILPIAITQDVIDVKQAWEKVEKLVLDKYKGAGAKTKVFLLQTLPTFGLIWNITTVTMTFLTVNVKMNAITGAVIEDTSKNLLDFRAK